MSDKANNPVRQDNIRGLVQDVSEVFDEMANMLRQKTAFVDTRPADAKTFMLISRHPRGLTALANALGITRQATHRSVQRLVAADLVEFNYVDGSKRDMIATLTKAGLEAQKVGLGIAANIEQQVIGEIGQDDAAALRRILKQLSGIGTRSS